MNRLTFTKADRIRQTAEYRLLSKKGKRHFSDCFVIVFRKNNDSISRLGITVSRKVGKAVTRNRIKRIIRDYFRLNRSVLPCWMDINVIARQSCGRIGSAEIRNHLESCFEMIVRKGDV